MSSPQNEPIAIIGNACRFPGDSTSPSKLWDLLKQPREVSRNIDRFQSAGFYNKDGHYHGASNVQHSYLLNEDPRLFDAQFFNIPPGEAESIDPQQRMILETVYDAVETSGLVLENLRGSNTAVYVGVMCDDYGNICYVDQESIPTYAATGTARSILSNRVSFIFDWRGPSMTIDTACSSSLVALHQGVQVLRSGTAPVAIAAGANLIFSPNMFIAESNLNMLSPTGHSQMWDANADGYARGEGIAAVVMKRLSDAIRDGDNIECIIRETGVNQDGHTPGITMPSQEAQTRLIHDTYARAGLDLSKPEDRPQYFEAHGTGTKAGDGVESKAIYKAFFPESDDKHDTLWVGSIKTIIGHTEEQHHSPNMHFNTLNPEIKPYYGKLQIATAAQNWPKLAAGSVPRASVNSFGFGGTNAHAIIEAYVPEAPKALTQAASPAVANPLALTFSATSEKSLTALMANYLEYLTENSEVDIGKLAWTLHDRRSTFTYRSSVAAQTQDELVSKLQKSVEDQQSGSSSSVTRGGSAKKNLLGVFTGQGAQWATMGRDLISSSKFAENIIDTLEKSLDDLPESDRPSWSLKEQMMADPSKSRITEGELSQPLCTAVQVMLVEMLKVAGIEFDSVVGHSSGEIGAAYASGFINATDAIRIAYYRGHYAYLARGPEGQLGGMLAAGTTLEDARELCDLPAFEGRVSVAAYNSSSSVTLSGDLDAIEEVKEVLEDERMFNRQLKVDTAYHSHHMIPCSKKYYAALDACKINIMTPSGRTKWYSSVYDGKVMDPCDALKHQYWVDNMVNIVLFATSLSSALTNSEPKLTQAIELGPHAALKGPASTVIEETIKSAIPYTGTLARGQNDVSAMATCFANLWAQFGRSSADWKAYYGLFADSTPKSMLGLPSYPFNHDRVFWYEARKSRVNRLREDPAHVLLGTRTDTINEREIRWRNYIHSGEIPWLQGHNIQGQTLFPAAGFLVMAVEAARIAGRAEAIQAIELKDSAIHRALAISDDKGIETLFTLSNVKIADIGDGTSVLTARFSCDACLQKQSDNFVAISSGEVIMTYGTPSSTALVEYPKEEGLGMLDVDADLFYAYLANIGYNYADMFKGITSLRRTTDLAQGIITTKVPESLANDPIDQFLLHPSTLDVAFQAIFAAISFPGDGALWDLHIPTTIRRVTINPVVCPINGGVDEKVRFSATSHRADDGTFSGCVDIFPVHSDYSMCQVEGLEVSPVSPPTAKDDRPFFGQTNHWLSLPDADSFATALRISSSQEGEKSQLDRLAVSYLRNILQSSSHETDQLKAWAQTVLANLGNKASLPVMEESDVSVREDSAYKTNLRILKTIGAGIEKGELPQGANASDLLNTFYNSSLGAPEAREALGVLAQQIVRRYPHMNILDLSSGSGSVTNAVMDKIGALFSAYTCTGATDEHFDQLSKDYPAISTRTLDFSEDLEEQGFFAGAYDLVIAGNGFHTIKDNVEGMQKLRSLVRPGGYLLAQQITNSESAHVGLTVASVALQPEEVSSTASLVADLGEYDEILRTAGFSGIDTVTPDSTSPFTVFVSQAVDQQILNLREPLQSSKVDLENVLLIGGQRFQVSRMVETMKKALAPFAKNVDTIRSLNDLDASMLATRPYVISLTELDDPFFENLTETKWEALKTLFFRSRYILWATQGADGDAPFANVMKGVVRCMLVEIPHLHAQMFNVEGQLKPEKHALTMLESVMRLHISDTWKDRAPAYDPLWSVEREYMLKDDKLWIMRYDSEESLNAGYNALRRRVVQDVSTKNQVVALTPEKKLQQYRLSPKATVEIEGIPNSTITVQQSLSSAIKVENLGFMHLSVGKEVETGATVVAFSEKDQSSLTLPKSRLLPVDVPDGKEHNLLVAIACNMLASDLLGKVVAGDRIVLHEPPTVLAKLLIERVANTGVQLLFTTTRRKAALQAQWKHIHAYSTDRDMRQITAANTAVFVDFSNNERRRDVVEHLTEGLPFGTRKYELGDFLPSRSILYSDSTEEQVSAALENAHLTATAERSSVPFDNVANTRVQQIADDAALAETLTTVDWTDATPFPASVTLAMDEINFRPDRTYFLIGMTGSLGLSTCEYMMQRGARFFALSSRRPNVDKRWLDKVSKAYGAVVKAFPLDITSRASLQKVHDDINDTMPPIAGVANGALIMRDGLFMDSSCDTMNEALGPKVAGSVLLDELFYNVNLDFFMLYSSLVYVTGNIGQTSYAAGNGFMVSLVHGRRARGLNASVMNLGGISGIGYITRTDHGILGKLDILGYGIMSELDYKYFFAESVMAGAADSGRNPEVSAGLRYVNKTEKNPPSGLLIPSSHTTSLTVLLVILSVHSDVAIVEMGVDSLVAVDLRSWFSNEFEHDIPVIKILGGATLADLVEDTVANMSPDICPNVSLGSNGDTEAKPEAAVDLLAAVEPSSSDSSSSSDERESATSVETAPIPAAKPTKEVVAAPESTVAIVPKKHFVREEKMTYGCSRFWFLRQYLEDSTCFNVLVQTRLNGNIDSARLQEAVRKLGARHESLRTAFFVSEKGEPRMGVMSDSLLRLEVEKIQEISQAEKAYQDMMGYNFDIERGEVIRMRLLSLSDKDHVFIFAVHHIAMDGFSFNLMIRDLDMMYQGKPVPQIPAQFTDFAIQQRRDVEAGRMRNDVAFWKKTFSNIPDPLPLFPFTGVSNRMPLVKYEHEEVELSLDAAMAQKIRNLCRQNRCTTFHFFLATFQIFLSKWLEVDDLCIGIADANRSDIKTLSTIGFLLNLVPLRFSALNAKAPFSSVLAAAKQTAYNSLAHSKLPFDLLLEELNLPRSSSTSPLFQAFLDYRQLAVKTPPMLESSAEGEQNFGATSYDVILDVTDYAMADIKIKWQTQKALYNTKHTEVMMESYMSLLNHFANSATSSVESAPLYRPEAVKAAVEVGQGLQFDAQWPETLSLKIDEISAKFPESPALVDVSNKFTYTSMNRLIDQITEELAQGGVKAGDKVGIFQQPSSLWISSLLAVWRAGAVYVPLDPRNGVPRLASTVGVVQPQAIIHDDANSKDVAALAAPASATIININNVRKKDATVTRRPNLSTGNSSAIIVSSSGSTGVPKCIEVRHSSLSNLFEGDSQTWKLGSAKVLQQSAYSFDISLDQIMTAFVNGGTLYVASEEERTNPELISKVIVENNINYTTATPSEYSNWIGFACDTLSKAASWRIANVGGEGWNSTLRDSFANLKLSELVIRNNYGPAEASVWATRYPIEYPGKGTLIPAGPALANYSFYIIDKKNNVVPTGVQGEILIGGAGVAVGYYKNAELTKDKFITDKHATEAHAAKGWDRAYKTGDKGYLTEDGTLIVQGRISGDTQIKLRGFRIELEDIESTIVHASQGVLTRAVANVRGDGPASYLVAFAEFADGYPAEEQDAYLSKLISKLPLPQYMRPNMMVPIVNIPVNSHNKVNRLAIATLPLRTTSDNSKSNAELTETAKTIRDIWVEILPESIIQNTTLNNSSDFFVLGGNSLLTVRLQSRLREIYGVFVPLIKIMESPTLDGLGNLLDELLSNQEINWDVETALSDEMLSVIPVNTKTTRPKTSDLTVILTGVSGFIGRHLLQRLIEDKNVSAIHCVAVRNIEMDSPSRQKMKALIASTDKVQLHPGDLSEPRLGLSEAEFETLSKKVDMIVHSGANRSFWSAYDMVRAPNVQSTKELALMAATALRDSNKVVPFHFMSGSEDAGIEPSTDGSNGYVASKWASEQFLRRFADKLGLPVHVHRQLPVPEGRTAQGEELDSILQEFVDVAAKMPELPNPDTWRGYYDLIPADRLSDDVVDLAMSALASTDNTFSKHSHYSSVRMDIGEVIKKIDSLDEYKNTDRPLIPAHVWVGKAKIAGFRYQFSTMKMSLQDAEGKNMGFLER
ncbi:Beta-ketoacyl synthase [Cordyceps militaris]|uniref:Beta-ketoacyl synthase n=1 Tax=Cordyceps militaris TaxID=73501 RepID=A0A2H4SNI9_CORMI|nr:Beta-ketoacyl synthase [Cordyceps militaris]